MFSDTTDGNLAALRQYEKLQEKQDEAWEYTKASADNLLSKLDDIVGEILALDEDSGYDFEGELKELIRDTIDV